MYFARSPGIGKRQWHTVLLLMTRTTLYHITSNVHKSSCYASSFYRFQVTQCFPLFISYLSLQKSIYIKSKPVAFDWNSIRVRIECFTWNTLSTWFLNITIQSKAKYRMFITQDSWPTLDYISFQLNFSHMSIKFVCSVFKCFGPCSNPITYFKLQHFDYKYHPSESEHHIWQKSGKMYIFNRKLYGV